MSEQKLTKHADTFDRMHLDRDTRYNKEVAGEMVGRYEHN